MNIFCDFSTEKNRFLFFHKAHHMPIQCLQYWNEFYYCGLVFRKNIAVAIEITIKTDVLDVEKITV